MAHVDHIDQISNLPSHLIDNILERLPLEDVVRTSVLSSGWRFQWASVSKLDFSDNFFEKCKDLELHEISTIITETLLLHNDPIHEFSLCIPNNFPIKIESLNKWILYLSRKGIKILELTDLQIDTYETPISHIFSCLELSELYLCNFTLSTVPNFHGFKSLTMLQLFYIAFDPNAFESLMIGCPSLEMFSISHCSGFEYINVYSPTLKVLHVQSEVIKSVCLEKVKNMSDLSLKADIPGDNFDINTISNLIKGLSKIQTFSLTRGYIQFFSICGMLPRSLKRPLNGLKNLELDGVDFMETTELLIVISLLKCCPNIEKLSIKRPNTVVNVEPPQIVEESRYNDCCLSHLQTVHIKVYKPCENTLNFIRFLLANSASLELLTLCINDSEQHFPNIGQELQQMARASERALVEFINLSLD